MLFAAAVGFAVSALVGWFLVPALRRWKAGQSIKTDGPTWHMSKQGTPTMGGIMFIAAIAVTVFLVGWPELTGGDYSAVMVLAFALVFGAIGFVDDYAKLKKHENTGLTAPQKFLLQLAAAIAFTVLLRYTNQLSPNLYLPFFGVTVPIPWVVYMVFAAFVMVGCVNAVNITDGIDGLAAGVTVPVALFYTVVCALWGKTALGTFSGALLGALLGFLLYNFHPCQGVHGGHGVPVPGRGGVRAGLRPGYAPDPHPCGHHLHCGDRLRHHPGSLLQGHPRQAYLPYGPPAPPPGTGRLVGEKNWYLCSRALPLFAASLP